MSFFINNINPDCITITNKIIKNIKTKIFYYQTFLYLLIYCYKINYIMENLSLYNYDILYNL